MWEKLSDLVCEKVTLVKEVKANKGWQSIWKKDHLTVRELSDRLVMAERAFTGRNGLLGKSWFKHLVS